MFKKIYNNMGKPKGFFGRHFLRKMNVHHAELSAWGRGFLNLPEASVILDAGCGGGANIAALLEKFPHSFVHGLDYSEESVALSRKQNAPLLGKRCEIIQGNILSTPYGGGQFDAVTAVEAIYFWKDIVKAFSEVKRILKPNGVFLIVCELCDPSDTHWEEKIDGLKVYSGEMLEPLLKEAGFSSVEIHEKDDSWLAILARK